MSPITPSVIKVVISILLVSCPDHTPKGKGLVAFATFLGLIKINYFWVGEFRLQFRFVEACTCLGRAKFLSNFTYSSLPSGVVCIVLCLQNFAPNFTYSPNKCATTFGVWSGHETRVLLAQLLVKIARNCLPPTTFWQHYSLAFPSIVVNDKSLL